MKKIFIIDWALIPAFVLSAYTGIELHLASGADHDLWHNWAVAHIVTSLLFLIGGILHVQMHWGWYKGIAQKGLGKRSRVTLALSLAFAFVVASGLILVLAIWMGQTLPWGCGTIA